MLCSILHSLPDEFPAGAQANMGAKNHAVILPDAHPEATVAALTGAAFGAAGQRSALPSHDAAETMPARAGQPVPNRPLLDVYNPVLHRHLSNCLS